MEVRSLSGTGGRDMMSRDRGGRFGLKVALAWVLAWVALGLGCAAENARPPSDGQEVLVVVVALDLKDNTILASKTLSPLTPDRPLGAGRSIGAAWLRMVNEHCDGPSGPHWHDYDEWYLGVGLSFPSVGDVMVDAEWECPAGRKMDRAETPLQLIPGRSAVLVMHEEGKPRLAVQFVVVTAARRCD